MKAYFHNICYAMSNLGQETEPKSKCLLLAEDCLLPGFSEGLLLRNQTLKTGGAAAIF